MPVRTEAVMGTLVTIQIVPSPTHAGAIEPALDRAFGWFREVEARCTRFDEQSELRQLSTRIGVAVSVSAILFEAVQFALMVAEQTGGAFDPTVGRRMEGHDDQATWRDITLDPVRRTITLHRPLILDLGAVAKGLAVDTAAHELRPFRNFAIDAGGDMYLGGFNPHGHPWSVGIRHPRLDRELIETVQVTDQAVCTSGDYERQGPAGAHHILDPRRTGTSPDTVASATVIASGAMLADALATAAFVLGPEQGIRFLERMGVNGLIVTPNLRRYESRGLFRAA